MSVYAVFGNINFSIAKPFYVGFSHIKIDYFIPLLVPGEVFSSNFIPKLFGSLTDFL
jgi:hypothetical protein